MNYIATTRFNGETWNSNKKWREKHNWKGCIYGLSKKIPLYFGKDALIYVVEMNNDTQYASYILRRPQNFAKSPP